VAIRIPLLLCIATVLAVGVRSSRGDIVVRVEVKDSNQKADAAPLLTVETLAGTGGHFSAKTTVAKQTVMLKGDLKKRDGGMHEVHVTFSSNGDDGSQEISTSITLPLNKPKQISGLQGAGGQRSIVLTLEEAPAAAAK
jgi:hypothetical protein